MTSSSSTPGNSLIGPSTSSIRRKHAAAHRTHMACVPCRDAKHKCDGVAPPVVLYAPPGGASREAVVSEQPCSRCAAQSLPCVWQPKAKLGRPRKESSASMPGSTSTTSSSSVISPARPLAPLSIPAPTPVAGASSATSDYFSSPGAATRSAPVTPAALGLGLSQLFSPPSAPTPALHPILNTSHRPISRFNVRPGSPIRDGIQAYFALGLRCCLAFLPSSRDTIETLLDKFSTTIATTPSMTALPSEARRVLCLGRTLAVVGLRLRDDGSGGGPPASMRAESETSMRAAIWNDLYQCSRQDIDEDPLEATANSPQNVVFALQTLLLGSMLEYGLGDIQRARSIMERALNIIEVLRINLLDAPGNQPQGRVPEELRRTFWETAAVHHGCSSLRGHVRRPRKMLCQERPLSLCQFPDRRR
ncbi:hypothetical protein BDZ90DRAFT_139392 [Jaminaea rosea]|uniref:Zn(2)-C6 fungal-type domain-containing protein n=1 Tax=Jaminaea rosea TaxID=1569628 RepID=A0A316UUY6_9BASI|nr:hypothetical protein BDZ90DRAFT_139392 [Jaminaea rosea]PWN29117.1 hypothetical protein BDZ90DRAFT_139392 [Jaminaea rosea]